MSTLPQLVPLKRLGIISPPANPALEPEMRALLPLSCGIHATRLPTFPGQPLEVRTTNYPASYAPLIQSFGALPIDAFLIGITGVSYALTPELDEKRSAHLSAGAGGRPVIQAANAIRETLTALGVRDMRLLSPYPRWLTDQSVAYWTACGFNVTDVFRISEEFRAYELTTPEVIEAVGRFNSPPGSIVLMSGTGMVTVDAMTTLVKPGGPILLSSNLCCAFTVLRRLGLPPTEHFRAVAPELTRLLGA